MSSSLLRGLIFQLAAGDDDDDVINMAAGDVITCILQPGEAFQFLGDGDAIASWWLPGGVVFQGLDDDVIITAAAAVDDVIPSSLVGEVFQNFGDDVIRSSLDGYFLFRLAAAGDIVDVVLLTTVSDGRLEAREA